MTDAAHVEYGADPETALITTARCELQEVDGPRIAGRKRVLLTAGSRAAAIYSAQEAHEEFHCSNELNRRYQPMFEKSDLKISGVGDEGEARIVELSGHPFFVGTLYLPQNAALNGQSHPLIDAFVQAAAGVGSD
jgi:CTP synthase (UTP-ammonia lyase)